MSSIDDWLDNMPKPIGGLAPEEKPDIPEGDKLKEFFFPKKRELNSYQDSLRREGRCPDCALPGRISMSAFVCDTHGEF